jgi:hypothetical protein
MNATKDRILLLLSQAGELTVKHISDRLEVSRQMVHRSLAELQEQKRVEKLGKPPKTYYRILHSNKVKVDATISEIQQQFLNENFMVVTETGKRLEGLEAMSFWCQRQRLPLTKTILEFIETRKKYLKYFSHDGLIHGMEKLTQTKAFDSVSLDEMLYFDFYAIERFGKSKLGTLLHFAKQGQNKTLMQEVVSLTKERLENVIAALKIDAVGYIPPTIKRDIQIMKFFKSKYNLTSPHLELTKVSSEIVIPQKALNKIEDRISNARASIMVEDQRHFNRVLLIDDAVGSGATLNETAAKLKSKKIASWVAGLAITGSFKGFEVIQEV